MNQNLDEATNAGAWRAVIQTLLLLVASVIIATAPAWSRAITSGGVSP